MVTIIHHKLAKKKSRKQKEQLVSILTTSLQICESKRQKERPCVFVVQL